MLFLIIVIALGFFPKQEKRYWIFASSAIVVQLIAQMLFAAGGTLQSTAGDGYITAILRQATNDDERVLWVFPFAMAFGWALPIYLVHKGYVRKQKNTDEIEKTE